MAKIWNGISLCSHIFNIYIKVSNNWALISILGFFTKDFFRILILSHSVGEVNHRKHICSSANAVIQTDLLYSSPWLPMFTSIKAQKIEKFSSEKLFLMPTPIFSLTLSDLKSHQILFQDGGVYPRALININFT